MSTKLGRTRLRDAAYAAMWSILPAKLDAVLEFLDLRAEGHTLSKRELARRGFSTVALRPGTVEASQGGRVAVIPVNGVIAHHAGFEMQISGGSSTVGLGQAFDAALNDPNVSAIVFDVDSPGGTVEGVAELFEKIYSARGKKPIKAVCNANMHSAAYWGIGAPSDEIIITPSGSIGNIGVMTVMTSYAEAEKKDGIERRLVKAGKFKGEGAPFGPISDEAEAARQKEVDDVYGASGAKPATFVGDVARGRKVKADDVRAGYGEGRSVRAREAVKIGLADRIATLEAVLAEFGAKAPANANARGGMTALHAMDEDPGPCPDCWGEQEMKDGEPFCPECDDSDTDALTPAAAIAAVAAVLPELTSVVAAEIAPSTLTAAIARPGGSPAVSPAPTTQTTTQDNHMPDTPNTPAPTQAEMLATLRAAEKERRDQITALCTDHGMTLKAMEYINADMTVAQVKDAILAEKKSTTNATRVPIKVTGVEQRSDKDPKKGFPNHREFLAAVVQNRARDFSQIKDERLKALAVRDGDDAEAGGEVAYMLPTGLTATVGSDEQGNYSNAHGGFAGNLVTRLPGMLQTGFDGDPTAGRTQDVPMATTTVEILSRVDKDHTTSVSGGFTVSRRAETQAITTSRMSMEKVSMRAASLFGGAYETEELIQDSPMAFAAIIEAGFRDQFGAHILKEKIRGLGDNEYLGVLNAGCTVEQAKESNQTADTIVTANVVKMRSRCWGYGNAIWIANHDTYPSLSTLSVGVGAAGSLVYQPSVVEDRPDSLLGRPIFYSEFASKLGDVGDIMLLNMSQYLEGTYQPLQSAESIHVRFLNHERVFKFWTRNAGQPWWRSALTPNQSAVTLSPFVTLAAR